MMPEQEIIDMSNGCGENYAVVIVSEQFEGKMTLARHRLGKWLVFLMTCEYHSGFPHEWCREGGVATRLRSSISD